MSNWKFLNAHRVNNAHDVPRQYWSTEAIGWNGMFRFYPAELPELAKLNLRGVELNRIRIICSDGEGWKHVSVSIEDSHRVPRWEIMCAIKDLFFEDEDCVIQFHPPKSQYVNQHPGCLHLWMPTNQKIPTPPTRMVGIKS